MGFWSTLTCRLWSSSNDRKVHSRSTRPTKDGGGFLSNAHSLEIHDGNFTDASHARITNVYNGGQGKVKQTPGLDLLQQHMAPSALHNSSDRFDAPKCDEDTRIGVVEEIMTWIKDISAPTRILCMTGPAGTGKSALEQTVAETCERQGVLAASFFFSASDVSRNNKTALVATIAYQVAQNIKDARDFIGAAALEDPAIFKKSLEAQINALLVQPLRQAAKQRGREGGKWPHAILIDGLDECHGIEHQTHILSAIHNSLIKQDSHFRVFIASRPEYAIRTALAGQLCEVAYHIELDEKYNPDHDIRLYLQRRLVDLGRRSRVPGVADGNWPAENDVKKLVENASGQFIYAATVIRFIEQRHFSPAQRLELLLTWKPDQSGSRNPFTTLDTLYLSILDLAQGALVHETDDPLSIVRLLKRLRAIQPFCLNEKISFMEQFYFFTPGEIRGTLTDLHALVKLADDTVAYHHKSFADFLDHPSRCGKYYLSKEEICTELVSLTLKYILHEPTGTPELMQSEIKFQSHPDMNAYFCSALWLGMITRSTQDDSVLRALDQLDFERWISVIKPFLSKDHYFMETYLTRVIEDIDRKHASSEEWLRVRARLAHAREVVKDTLRKVEQSHPVLSRGGVGVSRGLWHAAPSDFDLRPSGNEAL